MSGRWLLDIPVLLIKVVEPTILCYRHTVETEELKIESLLLAPICDAIFFVSRIVKKYKRKI